jgi:DNA polymerase eta
MNTSQRSLVFIVIVTTEKASIDEAYLDLTALTISEILRRHNHLAGVPHDAPQGEDTPLPPPPPVNWDPVSSIFPIGGENESEQEGEVEQFVDSMTDEIGSWQDYALSVGAELMDRIRSEVKRELGYTCSAVS